MKRGHWGQFPKLMAGFAVFATGISLMIQAGLGLDPWSAFHMGLSLSLPISYGVASASAGIILLAIGMWFFQQKLDWGTVLNMFLIGFMVDAVLLVMPDMSGLATYWRWPMFLGGIGLVGLATGMYISSGWGAGPRDGFVIGVSRRTGFSVRVIRTCLELTVLGAGALLGAPVGWGTLAFALLIGPAMQASLSLFRELPAPTPAGSSNPA